MPTCESNNKFNWLALRMIPGLGNIAQKKLIDKFGCPEKIFMADLSDLMNTGGIRKKIAQKIILKQFSGDPVTELKKIEDFGARIITYSDQEYPDLLRKIHDPPMIFNAIGRKIKVNQTNIGIVGSRNATHYGLKIAEEMGQGLSRRGLGVVSGMARGIDSAAHWGSLLGKGHTIAVLGTGIDVIYPKSNEKLFKRIVKDGTVISEFPLGTPPNPNNFPIRNRIISGLSRGVIVVEATKRSGSLITASQALDQGREVFAVPGSINSFKSTGCHFLIKQGARLIEHADDVLEELGLNFAYKPKTDTFNQEQVLPLDKPEECIYNLISDYPIHIDQIAQKEDLKPGEVSSILTRMELKGVIKQLPGKMFVRYH